MDRGWKLTRKLKLIVGVRTFVNTSLESTVYPLTTLISPPSHSPLNSPKRGDPLRSEQWSANELDAPNSSSIPPPISVCAHGGGSRLSLSLSLENRIESFAGGKKRGRCSNWVDQGGRRKKKDETVLGCFDFPPRLSSRTLPWNGFFERTLYIYSIYLAPLTKGITRI